MRDTIVSALTDVAVVEVDGSIGGFSVCSLNDGFIRALYVAPQRQGRGLGRLLLSHAEGRLATAGHLEARLNASANAVSFYRSAGYRPLHATTQALADGSLLDCTAMAKVIGADRQG